jgi:hypothetical protein
MPNTNVITQIYVNTVETMLIEEETVLIACLRNDADHHKILDKIKPIAVFTGPDLRVCYAMEDLLPYFENRYMVMGTPTFLLIRQGKLLDSVIGGISAQDLLAWIRKYMKRLGISKVFPKRSNVTSRPDKPDAKVRVLKKKEV